MKEHKLKQIYTTGSVAGTMCRNAVAMIAGTLAMSGYNLADTYFVGQIGGDVPLAAMGFTFPVVFLLSCIFRGLGVGVMTPVAQALGGNKHCKAANLVSSGILLVFLCSILVALFGMASGRFIIGLLGAEGKALDMAGEYMNIWYFGCATAALSMVGNDIMIAAGSAKTAGFMMMFGLLINVILDPLFIFGMNCRLELMGGAVVWHFNIAGTGIRGAAVATVLSQLTVTLLAVLILSVKHRLVQFKAIPYRRLKKAWVKMISYAVPSIFGMLVIPVGFSILTKITASFGNVAVAATAAAGRLEMVAFVLPMAFGMTLVPTVAQNFGARLYSRIRECFRFALLVAGCYLFAMSVLYCFTASQVVGYFTPDVEVQKIMMLYLHIVPWSFAMVEIHRYCGFFYTGCGKPAGSAWLNALRIIGLLVPLSLLALWANYLTGLFLARVLADTLSGIVGIMVVRRLLKKLPENDGAVALLR